MRVPCPSLGLAYEKKIKFTTCLKPSLINTLREMADKKDVKISDIVDFGIRQALHKMQEHNFVLNIEDIS